jgi:hypothetical protein
MLVMDSRHLSFPVDRPRVHSAGLSSPPPLLIATTTSPPACLRRRRLVSPPIRSVGHTTVDGHRHLHRRPASAYTAGLLCRRCWASTTSPPACLRRRRVVPPPTRLAYYTAAVGRLRLHRRLASVAAEWCLRLHGWPIMPPLLGVYDFTAGLPPSPPTGASAYTASLIMPPLLGIYDFTTGLPPSPPSGASAYTAGLPTAPRCGATSYTPGRI